VNQIWGEIVSTKIQGYESSTRPYKIPRYEPGFPSGPGYYGLPPDGGTSYGFSCKGCGKKLSSSKDAKNCPYCKSELSPTSEASNYSNKCLAYVGICNTCNKPSVASNLSLATEGSVFCVYCGSSNAEAKRIISALANKQSIGDVIMSLKQIVSELREKAEIAETAEEKEDLLTMAQDLEDQEVESASEDENHGVEPAPDAELEEGMFKGASQAVSVASLLIDSSNSDVVITASKDEDIYGVTAESEFPAGEKYPGGTDTYKDKKGDTFDVDTPGKEIMESEVDEDGPEILDEEDAKQAIQEYSEAGVDCEVIRVESGFIVKASEEMDEGDNDTEIPVDAGEDCDDEEEMEVLDAKAAKDKIEEINATGKSAKVVKVVNGYVVKAQEEAEESDEEEESVLSEVEAERVISSLISNGKSAKVTRVVNGYVVTASEEEEGDDEIDEEEASIDEPMEDSEDSSSEEGEEPSEASVLTEKEAEKAIASITGKGNKAKVTKVIGGYVVVAESEDEEEILDEDAAEAAIASITDSGKKARVTRVLDGYVVKAEEDCDEEDSEEIKSEEEPPVEDDSSEEESVESEEEPPVEDDAEEELSLKYETLSSTADFKDIKEDDVTMLLHAESEKSPYYNVLIKGHPIAKVALLDQKKPDEYRSVFVKQEYAMNLVDAMLRFGVDKTLTNVNAKFYANEKSPDRLRESVVKEVVSKYQKEYSEAVASMRDDLLDRVGLVLAAFNKNFYNKDISNPLKAALYEKLFDITQGALSEGTIASVIEESFDKGAVPFFAAVVNKATEYLDTPEEALAEIRKVVVESPIIPVSVEADVQKGEKTFAQELAENSMPINPAVLTTAKPDNSYDAMKKEMKRKLQLGKFRV